jgi:hypothetical protein
LFCRDTEQDRNPSEIIATYQAFLTANPPDARRVPEACYSISYEYFLLMDMDKAKHYYQKGIEAENPNVRLPCFPPVKDFPPKKSLQLVINSPPEMMAKIMAQYRDLALD